MKRRLIIFWVLTVCAYSLSFSQIDTAHYLFNKFEEATVYFTDGSTGKEKINYNIIEERFFFIDRVSGNLLMVVNSQDIRIIKVGNRSFMLEKGAAIEVLPTNPVVYVQYKANIRQGASRGAYGGQSETTSITSLGSVYNSTTGERVELASQNYLVTNHYNIYWVEKKGKKKRFITFKQFLKLYSDHKDELEKFIKENNIEFNNAEQIAKLCVYADSL